jgi:hypothetical protein
MVAYHVGEHVLSHEAYMRALGASPDSIRYPGFSNDPLDAFRDLASDLEQFASEFTIGDASVLRAAAPIEAARQAEALRVMRAASAGDERNRAEAKRLFRAGDYARVVVLLDALQYPELMSPSEKKALALARRRASEG